MKKNLFTSWFILFSMILYGQTVDHEKGQEFTHQLGFDASAFITRFLSFNSQTVSSNTGLIFLYRKGKDGKNFRLAASPRIRVTNDNDLKSSFIGLNLKIGKEYYNDFGKRWRAYVGWDIGFRGSTFTRRNSGNKSFEGNLQLSVGPLVGLQFRINRWLSLSTEANYELIGTYEYDKDTNENVSKFYGLASGFSPLSFITLNYHF